jgi:hypothetical protein
VNPTFVCLSATINGPEIREELFDGQIHVVAPCVMLVSNTVLEGSEGRGFYPADENARAVPSWNTKPLVANHPQKDGKMVTAADPAVLTARGLGFLLNTRHDGKLRTEAWFNKEKTKRIDDRILVALAQRKKIEVSTGLFLDKDMTSGKAANGDPYDWIARNQQPDHLAVLMEGVGACSVAMGAGLLANAAVDLSMNHGAVPRLLAVLDRRQTVAVNELSFDDISRQLRKALSARFGAPGEQWDGWVIDLFPDSVVFWDKEKMFRMGYKASSSGVELQGDPVEVVRTTDYQPVGNESGGGNTMPFDKKAHVTALISNGQIEEKDRATFEALDEKVLQSMKVLEKTPATPPTPVPAANATPTPSTLPVTSQTTPTLTREQVLNMLSPQERESINEGMAAVQNERVKLTAKVKGQPGNQFTEEYLLGLPIVNLRAIAALIPEPQQNGIYPATSLNNPAPIFLGNAGAAPPGNAPVTETPLKLPVLEFPNPTTNAAAGKK